PKDFDEVVGQQHISQTLKNEISQGHQTHAYLFTGSRGTGKTSCSKIIAKAVNCPNQTDGNPCGECEICMGIDDGSMLDITELDAASNNGVDNIRQLREEAQFTPAICKYRVYIIDEVHMLSTGAFNALLKIMEEPPEHVIFILATTEVHKIPATIISRCQRFDFKRIDTALIAEHLSEVSLLEGIELEPDAGFLIAKLSEGGMRDALSLLDVCRSYNNHITMEIVADAAGLMTSETLFKMADAVLDGDIAAAIKLIDKVGKSSVDYPALTGQLLGHYRNLMLLKAAGGNSKVLDVLPEQAELLDKQMKRYSMAHIMYCMTVLQETLNSISRSTKPRTSLEMGIIRMSDINLDSSLTAIVTRLDKLETQIKLGKVKFVPQQNGGENTQATSAQQEDIPIYQDKPIENRTEIVPFTKWSEVLNALQKKNAALYGALVNSGAYLHEDIVLIESKDEFFTNLIRTNDFAKKSLHEAIIEVTGKKHRLGPYRSEKYKIVEPKADMLDEIIAKAEKTSIDLSIK
ncbi:MAG: DNA polymerase III subunit gamma/tau, partial [Oscillospiraceae bacterium]